MLHGMIVAMLISRMSGTLPAQHADATIVRIVGQHITITISSTVAGPRYSATDAGGKQICTNLTISELRIRHPELSRQVDLGICASAD